MPIVIFVYNRKDQQIIIILSKHNTRIIKDHSKTLEATRIKINWRKKKLRFSFKIFLLTTQNWGLDYRRKTTQVKEI